MLSADNHLAIMAVLFGVVGAALWAERFSLIVQRLSVPFVVILVPLLLSNAGLIPRNAPAYDFVIEYFVIIAIPLLLLKADLQRIFSETGRTLVAFLLAGAGTALGVLLGYTLLPETEHSAQSAAAVAGGYIGGSMNFVAVAKAVELDDPTMFATTLGAETAGGLLYLMFLAAVPAMRWFKRWDRQTPKPATAHTGSSDGGSAGGATIMDMALALSLGFLISAAGIWIARSIGLPNYSILIITVVAVAVANLAKSAVSRLHGEVDVAMLLFYVFFATYGAGTDLVAMLRDAPVLLLFALVVVAVHFVVSFGAGRLIGLSGREIVIASNACLLGPPTAAAQATKEGWAELVTPGILCGVFGYVIGNFIGVSIYALLG